MPPPETSKPKYPIPWIATYFATAAILIAGAFGVGWVLDRPSSEFDYDDPDVRFLEGIVLSAKPGEGDFTQLNEGDWQALCLTGFQADTRAALEAAAIEKDIARAIATAADGIREDIAASEFALVYADRSGRVKAVRHPHGFAFADKGAAACTPMEQPIMTLPVARR